MRGRKGIKEHDNGKNKRICKKMGLAVRSTYHRIDNKLFTYHLYTDGKRFGWYLAWSYSLYGELGTRRGQMAAAVH